MLKRISSMILSVCLCLSIFLNVAMAADYTPNSIEGVQIRDTNNNYTELLSDVYYLLDSETGKPETDNASENSYHVYYNADTKMLTLNGAALKGPLFVPGDTIVELLGLNSIGTETVKVTGSGIEVDSAGTLTVQGRGQLVTYCTTEAITNTQSGGSITIREATLTLAEWQTSIYSRFGSITITDGADVTANDIKCAPTTGNDDGDGHIVISGDGTKVTAVAINTTDGKITISEKAVVEAVNNSGAAISGQTGVEVKTGAKVTAKGSTGAISAFRGDLDLDGEVYAEMTGGIYAALSVSGNNSINIKGKLTLVSKYTGAWAPGLGNITIDNGEVTVTADFGFITRINSNTDAAADGGNLIIKNGSKVSITGAMGVYMLHNKGVLTVDSSTLEINSSSWGIYNGGEVKMINSTVTCTPTNANNKAIGTSKIDYQYDNGYTFMAGDDANSAVESPAADQTANLNKSYVQITPKSVISVTGVELNKTELSLIEGNTETLIATVAPTDATNQEVTWKSNNPAVATVDENGVVTAVAVGSATITVTTVDGSFTAICTVTVIPVLTAGIATRENETNATVKFTSNETGEYYYAVVESGATEPTIDTTGTGMTCEATEQTIFLDNLTGTGAKDIYIVFKDMAGDVSGKLKITIPAYIPLVYSISADSAILDFGSAYTGYTAPAAKTITITNTGNQRITLTQPTATNFEIGMLSQTSIDPNETATFTIKPKSGLSVGAYNETITVYGANGGGSTNVLSITAIFAVYNSPSSVIYIPSYSIIVNTTENGGVTVSRKTAVSGTTITITVTPDEGYTLETLTVLNQSGKEIELTDFGNGKYTFKMPPSKVTVTATFVLQKTASDYFTDVPEGSYYADAVLWAVQNGITTGVDENHFGSDHSCTRAQLVTFLYRYVQSQGGGFTGAWMFKLPFSDVSEWCYESVAWSYMNGIVQGYGNGQFGSDDAITREQMVVILYRFAQFMGMDVSVGADTNILSYNDAMDVSEYAMEAVQWATGAGILQGYDGNLMPAQPCTRAQIVTMLYRLLGA